MNEQNKTGADAMAGDGGYSLGTLKELDKFTTARNRSRVFVLAEEAGLYDEKTPEEVPDFTACFEKFAELIVQECANIAEYYYTRNECVSPQQIKQHFGVTK